MSTTTTTTATTTFEESIENFLNDAGTGKKPWFLTTAQIYKLVKVTVTSIPKSDELVTKALNVVQIMCDYINANTKFRVVLDADKCTEIANQIEDIINVSLMAVDDGFDHIRARIAEALKKLIKAIVEHKKWAESTIKTKKEEIQVNSASALHQAHVHLDKLLNALEDLAALIEVKYPKTTGKIKALAAESIEKARNTYTGSIALVQNAKTKVNEVTTQAKAAVHERVDLAAKSLQSNVDSGKDKLLSMIMFYLKTAQPYVINLVKKSEPLTMIAVNLITPYVVGTKKIWEPIVEKVCGIHGSLEKYSKLYQSISGMIATAVKEVKNYCFETDME